MKKYPHLSACPDDKAKLKLKKEKRKRKNDKAKDIWTRRKRGA
jgi:uncharacterized protein YbaR (Trm112 family)